MRTITTAQEIQQLQKRLEHLREQDEERMQLKI